jgi:hypothetical protein
LSFQNLSSKEKRFDAELDSLSKSLKLDSEIDISKFESRLATLRESGKLSREAMENESHSLSDQASVWDGYQSIMSRLQSTLDDARFQLDLALNKGGEKDESVVRIAETKDKVNVSDELVFTISFPTALMFLLFRRSTPTSRTTSCYSSISVPLHPTSCLPSRVWATRPPSTSTWPRSRPFPRTTTLSERPRMQTPDWRRLRTSGTSSTPSATRW